MTQSRGGINEDFPCCAVCVSGEVEKKTVGEEEGVIPGSGPFYRRLKLEKANSYEMMRLEP